CPLDQGDPMNSLTDRERLLCECILRRMCELCEEEGGMSEVCDGDTTRYGDSDYNADKELHPANKPQSCLCCHCRALECDNQCKTVSKVMDSVNDPVAEMKYFIDSIIFDLQAMDHVIHNNNLYPKRRPPSKTMGKAPGESFPVTITDVSSLGCRSLYVRWELLDCSGVAGYEIYVDGHLTNRFYSYRHEAGVVANVDVTKPHQIILRAQAVGQEFPGDDDCSCENAVVGAHPELKVGATEPWRPSVYLYDP
ncbi:hypothetical protein KR222_000467, partial [Zaprionus bogoriensis]